MTDDLEPRLRDLLAERGRLDRTGVTALLDGIATLPTRRTRPWMRAAAAVAAIALVGLGAFIAFRPSDGPGGPPVPPDPAAFAGDPRMDACFAGAGDVEAAFEMRHARDYQRHLPGMLRSPELEVDDPGFVVVLAGDVGVGGNGGPRPETGKSVCVLVGATPNLYTGVDVAGLVATLPGGSGDPTPGPTPTPTATTAAGPTVEPGPFWVADLAGQLVCDGPVMDFGGEVPAEPGPMDPAATPAEALEYLLVARYAWLPATGWEPPQVEGPWALHRYVVDGRLKAIAVSTNRFPGIPDDVGWEVVGQRACDPSEFDPGDGLTDDTTLWLDAEGQRAPTARIFSRRGAGHCGWEAIIFLYVEDKLYLRDLKGELADQTAGPFREVAALPADAVDTGLHTDNWHLFTVPDERFIYIRTNDGTIERWGRGSDDIGCA
jgi:hypothetical protein